MRELYPTRLPGGATVSESWTAWRAVTFAIAGEIDAFDRQRLVDLVTAAVLEGASQVVVDVTAVSFADTGVLHALDQVRRHLTRSGGCLEIRGGRSLAIGRALRTGCVGSAPHDDARGERACA